jgi:hypothetical protein
LYFATGCRDGRTFTHYISPVGGGDVPTGSTSQDGGRGRGVLVDQAGTVGPGHPVISWFRPATKPSSDVVNCQSTLPFAVCGVVSFIRCLLPCVGEGHAGFRREPVRGAVRERRRECEEDSEVHAIEFEADAVQSEGPLRDLMGGPFGMLVA